MTFGEILFDRFPDYKSIGGAPFNFCYHLMQFGEPVRFVSRVGQDDDGREILEYLEKRNFPTRDIQIDPLHKTGVVEVVLSKNGTPTFDILSDVAYDHIDFHEISEPPSPEEVDMIYFGTVVQRTKAAHENLHGFLAANYPRHNIFFDINLRPGCINDRAVISSLELTDFLKLNDEELVYLMKTEHFNKDEAAFISFLTSKYNLEAIALTRGESGSELHTREGGLASPPGDIENMADTVGAGDAYAALMALGYVRSWPKSRMIQTASQFAARICQIQGAVPDSPDFYRAFASEFGI